MEYSSFQSAVFIQLKNCTKTVILKFTPNIKATVDWRFYAGFGSETLDPGHPLWTATSNSENRTVFSSVPVPLGSVVISESDP